MKSTLLTTATYGLAAFGLALFPIHADNASATEPVIEAAVAKTVGVYIINISGKG